MKRMHLFIGVALVAAPLFGCGKSKIDQCNAFIEQANVSQTTINALNLDSEDAAILDAAAAKVEADAKKVDGVELQDAKLVGFKGEYVKNLNSLAKTVRDLGVLQKDAKDPAKAATVEAKAETITKEAEKLEKDSSKLIDQINGYCSGS